MGFPDAQKKSSANYEYMGAFHGCVHDVVDKIINNGFDRGFAGKNMCAYGKVHI